MDSHKKSRILAFQVLYAWEAQKKRISVESLLEFSWLDEPPDEETKTFARLLVVGVVENIKIIDETLSVYFENWAFSRVRRVDLAIMRMSTYSLMFQKDVPASVVISSAVAISRKFGADDSFRFINGVLDTVRKAVQTECKED
ncbi:MAG: transcription antitermination factor NusB [Treponema sp.]|jgi:N utilization substance protein B|nr:transcription antitermination factor NusB [Treponema sp.]